MLLSSLPGAAVTSIKIDGAQHEFQDVPGVKEDVTDIVLNVKKIRLRSFSDRPVTMRIEVTGERVVTGGGYPGAEHGRDRDPGCLHLHARQRRRPPRDGAGRRDRQGLRARRDQGRSAHRADPGGRHLLAGAEGQLHRREYARRADDELRQITLQIWTDGTITPDEALRQASQVLVQHFQMIAEHTSRAVEADATRLPAIAVRPGATAYQIPQQIYDTPIEELDLTVRAYNCLKRSGITKVGQVLTMSQDDLLAVRNFGEKSLNELKDSLSSAICCPTFAALSRAGHRARTDLTRLMARTMARA